MRGKAYPGARCMKAAQKLYFFGRASDQPGV